MGEGATRAPPCPASSSSTPPMPMRKPTATTSWRTDRTPNTLEDVTGIFDIWDESKQDLPPLREGEGDTTLCPIHPDRRAVQVVRRALRRVWSRRLRLLPRGRRYQRWPTSHGPHRGYGRPQERTWHAMRNTYRRPMEGTAPEGTVGGRAGAFQRST